MAAPIAADDLNKTIGRPGISQLYKRVGLEEFQKPRQEPNGLLYKRMALDLTAEHSVKLPGR